MNREEINRMVAQAAGNIDLKTTEQVLEGLEKVIISQMGGTANRFGRIITLYQIWKSGKK